MILYHGSDKIIKSPAFGVGNPKNDYGLGFYCTEHLDLAKEWACSEGRDGFANMYTLNLEDLKVLDLQSDDYHILNWLAILLAHRKFDINSPVGNSAREFILSRFMPDTTDVDVMIGYRADDSYFSFAEDFVNNTLSLRDLNKAMQLGSLGEQIVLLSKRAFDKIKFLEYEIADYREYYFKRAERDQAARSAYANQKKNLQQLKDDIFVLDIIREDMTHDDPRLQSVISE